MIFDYFIVMKFAIVMSMVIGIVTVHLIRDNIETSRNE